MLVPHCKLGDKELDEKILGFFGVLSFVCIDKVYHPLILRRDIFFEIQGEMQADEKIKKTMEEVVEKHESKRNKEAELKA